MTVDKCTVEYLLLETIPRVQNLDMARAGRVEVLGGVVGFGRAGLR